MISRVGFLLACLFVLAGVFVGNLSNAIACKMVPFNEYSRSASAVLWLSSIGVSGYELRRGCDTNNRTDCDWVGHLEVDLISEQSMLDLGVLIRVIDGEPPLDIDHKVVAVEADAIHFGFDDRGGQPPIRFSMMITLVDREGRYGPESGPFVIEHPGGNDACGCGCRAGSGGPLVAAALLLLIAVRRTFWRRRIE